MPTAALVALALALAAAPRAGSAQPDPSRAGPFSLLLLSASGQPLPTFRQGGRTFVLGTLGERYQLRVRNDSSERVEVVASVDGRDVLDGRPAALARRGYLVPARGEVVIDGFRLDAAAVAAFRFSSVPRSYAALTGDARDVGVVGAAIFRERARLPPVARAPSWSVGGDRADAAGPPSEPRGAAAAPAPEAQASKARRSEAEERPGLGTEFGERRASPVEEVPFERARGGPAALLSLRYDDREGLAALGIDVDGAWARVDEARRRERADPFPGGRGWAEPPPGWRR